MKKILLVILSTLLGCSSDDCNVNVNSTSAISYMKIVEQYKEPGSPPFSIKEYNFDSNGKVVKEIFTNNTYPIYSYTSTFEYDEQNRLIKEFKNGQLSLKVIWTGNVAELFSSTNTKYAEFTFANGKLLNYKWGYAQQAPITTIKYNYDNNDNVISIEKDNEVYVEYLQYQSDILNPLHLLKSIQTVRSSFNYNFKNAFNVERLYGYNGSDFIFQTTNYEYFRTLDSNNRVISATDMKTLIYKTTYEYN